MGQIPLRIDLTTGQVRRVDDDLDLPGRVILLDCNNTGTPRTCTVQGAGSATPGIRYNATLSRWELSEDGTNFYPIAFTTEP